MFIIITKISTATVTDPETKKTAETTRSEDIQFETHRHELISSLLTRIEKTSPDLKGLEIYQNDKMLPINMTIGDFQKYEEKCGRELHLKAW